MGVSVLWIISMALLPPDGLYQETWMFLSSGSVEKGFGNLAVGFGVFNSHLREVVTQERGMPSAFLLSTVSVTSSPTQYRTGTKELLEVSSCGLRIRPSLLLLTVCDNSFLIAHPLFLFFFWQLVVYLQNENLY